MQQIIKLDSQGLEEELRCAMCTNWMKSETGCDGGCSFNEHIYQKVIDVIKRRQIKNNMASNNWIKCKDELPKRSDSYLVTKMCENDGNPIYETAHEVFWISDNKWDCERDEDCEWKVTAWQNKLQPYTG